MRVVGGALRGRAIIAPKSKAIRPTADRLRESLFNILAHSFDDPVTGARVLDLFAGTGALGIEALFARRRIRAVRRRRRRGARTAARECGRARSRRNVQNFPPRRDQARRAASACAILARLPRPALRPRIGDRSAQFGTRRRLADAGRLSRRGRSDKSAIRRAGRLSRNRPAALRRHGVRLFAAWPKLRRYGLSLDWQSWSAVLIAATDSSDGALPSKADASPNRGMRSPPVRSDWPIEAWGSRSELAPSDDSHRRRSVGSSATPLPRLFSTSLFYLTKFRFTSHLSLFMIRNLTLSPISIVCPY